MQVSPRQQRRLATFNRDVSIDEVLSTPGGPVLAVGHVIDTDRDPKLLIGTDGSEVEVDGRGCLVKYREAPNA